LNVASITEHNASLQQLKFFDTIELSLLTNRWPWWAAEFAEFCKLARRIWQNLPRKTVGFNYEYLLPVLQYRIEL